MDTTRVFAQFPLVVGLACSGIEQVPPVFPVRKIRTKLGLTMQLNVPCVPLKVEQEVSVENNRLTTVFASLAFSGVKNALIVLLMLISTCAQAGKR